MGVSLVIDCKSWLQDCRLKCVKVANMENTAVQDCFWYPLRVDGGPCSIFKHYLDTKGVICYSNGKASGKVCFVRATAEKIDTIRKELEGRFSIRYLWDGITFSPARIEDKKMKDFITVAEEGRGSSIYLDSVSPALKECRMVRVTSGKFEGIEGRLVRVRKSKRVMIDLPWNIAVATEYIGPDNIEFID